MKHKKEIIKAIETVKNKVFEAYDKTLSKDKKPQDYEDYVYLAGFLSALNYVLNSEEPNYNLTFEKYLKYQI